MPIFDGLPIPESGQNRANFYPPINKPQPQIITQTTQHVIAVGPSQTASAISAQHLQLQQLIDPTQSLLREFETVLGDVEACHQTSIVSTLTPPQSPPPKVQQQLLITLQPLYQSGEAAFFYDQTHQQQQPITVVSFFSFTINLH